MEKQPIGKLLFQQFCDTNTQYAQAWSFLLKIEEYEMSDDDGESRRTLALSLSRMLSPEAENPCVKNYSFLQIH